MKRCYAIVAACILFASCQSHEDGRSETLGTTVSTRDIVDTALAQLETETNDAPHGDTSFPGFVATLKDGFDNVQSTDGQSPVFVLSKGQLFFYNSASKIAMLPNGRSGHIMSGNVRRADTPYFKFTFTEWPFERPKDDELYKFVSRQQLDLNILGKKIISGDKNAFIQFLKLQDKLDRMVWTEYYEYAWALINRQTDEHLLSIYQSQKPADKQKLEELLMAATPLETPEDYYRRYYPVTFKALQR